MHRQALPLSDVLQPQDMPQRVQPFGQGKSKAGTDRSKSSSFAAEAKDGTCQGTPSAKPSVKAIDKGEGPSDSSFQIGCYNLLAPCYALKWMTPEGITKSCQDNWVSRWPALKRVLSQCSWDVVCIVELGRWSRHSNPRKDLSVLCPALKNKLTMRYFKHSGRQDAVAVLYATDRFDFIRESFMDFNGAVVPKVDLQERTTSKVLRVLAVHQWHPKSKHHHGHLKAILEFAVHTAPTDGPAVDCTVLAGDFNEDAKMSDGAEYRELKKHYRTAHRERYPELPKSSMKRSKNKVDWIWVQGAEPDYDEVSQCVVARSHSPCDETGRWPSDHGMEAVRCVLAKHDEKMLMDSVLCHARTHAHMDAVAEVTCPSDFGSDLSSDFRSDLPLCRVSMATAGCKRRHDWDETSDGSDSELSEENRSWDDALKKANANVLN